VESVVTALAGDSLVAKSRAMRQVLDIAARVASSDVTLLITGESGTGKERLARFIHEHSPRAQSAIRNNGSPACTIWPSITAFSRT